MAQIFRLLSFSILLFTIGNVNARNYIYIVGSSTVYPFATVVAENFGRRTRYKTPKIESTGSGGGLKLFCAGVGAQHPDITNSSRRIKRSEVETCRRNGIRDVVEVKIGYDGIAIANSKRAQGFSFLLKDLYLALAKNVPDANGNMIPNPHTTWRDVNPSLPNTKIEVLGPPPTSGTRDAFTELAMEAGCKTIPVLAALEGTDKEAFKKACMTMREDGAYIEAGENDNLIVQKLVANPNALGIFGYSFLAENLDKVKGSKINGYLPTFNTIANSNYPLSRPLFFYVKKAHVRTIPGIKNYVGEFVNNRAIGRYGYLTKRGLIPLPKREQRRVAEIARRLRPMSRLDIRGL
ncbi:phosphate ABC transporter substrate-binding protein [Achromatium sp. WMS1]|nr:phosphate ABC transporter substrate-binding protein [Achromatium sp. WMS1]